MDYYLDITIKPNTEFLPNILMEILYATLHKALYDFGEGKVGCSFPLFEKKTLGNMIRLHGSSDSLEKLMSCNWTKQLADYLNVSDIYPVPKQIFHRVVKRVQVKSSSERLFRRSIKKGWITEDEAKIKILSGKDETTALPYLRIKSLSSNQHFRLFIDHGDILQQPVNGTFNHYGLSKSATIPWF